jgi:hypothetical protein
MESPDCALHQSHLLPSSPRNDGQLTSKHFHVLRPPLPSTVRNREGPVGADDAGDNWRDSGYSILFCKAQTFYRSCRKRIGLAYMTG